MTLVTFNIRESQVRELKEIYRSALFDDLVPWWEKHSLDTEKGGYFTRLNQDGSVYSGDKDMWMTGRQVWMFAHLYNNHENKERWKAMAGHGLDFMQKHAFKEDGKMYFRLDRAGKPLASVLSVYTEVFASIAVAEYAALSGDLKLKQKAFTMYDFLLSRLGKASDTPLLGYPLHREFHLHAHDMCRITVSKVFNDLWPDKQFRDDLSKSVDSILSRHWKPEAGYLLENVAMDGLEVFDLPEGRLFHPGHAIESAWMLMEIAVEGNDQALMDTAIDITLASLEYGWDQTYGGIRYMTNIDWTPTHELEADLKLWWPHSEALYALLMGWLYTGRDDLKLWYKKVHDYTFSKFPDKEHGEWFGY
ncbi:AGE family epimerase/isomerase, partial [Seonamhaeicola sp.]|uniref:AGE family epimerase/isomerase n=1 Tax=Seonamhaeicola sp. TaxID=1912245 RepID=UPI002634E501